MRRDRLPDGRRLCGYCRCYAPRWKLERLPNKLYRCRHGHGCRAPGDPWDPKHDTEHHAPEPRPVRPHIAGWAPLQLRLPRVEDLFPWIESPLLRLLYKRLEAEE